jgi:NAD(P)-dependent dehydrogenase (short-subunit alcohol dehydrogenase family)
MKHIVITGVSSGIGHAATADLLAHGYHVLGSVRRAADAERLQAEFGARFTPLLFDVTDHAAVQTAVAQTQALLGAQNLAGLVNNAGVSVLGPAMHIPLADFRRQFEINLFGLLDVTQQFLPLLGARRDAPRPRGRIVNISSVSGKIAYPFYGAYAASKHALEALSDALRRELLLYGIDVIVIEPGTTQTPIIDKAGAQVGAYAETDYAPFIEKLAQKELAERRTSALPVEVVAVKIRAALENGRPRTRIPIPRKWLTGWLIPRWLPDRWLDWLVARRLGFK